MGDQNTPLSAADAAHLLRRTGFGAPAVQVDKFTGMTRGDAADKLLAFSPSKFKPRGRTIDEVRDRWIKYMIGYRHAIQEKLVVFWHDHFATGYTKVQNSALMGNQNGLLRKFCTGNLKDFVKAINKDAAMMEFLDTVRNEKQQPNENYARELQELFTLGVTDYNGHANYTQSDIVQIARAFTGWSYDDKGVAAFNSDAHDFMQDWPARGTKVIYKTTGGFGAGGADYTQPAGEGAPEIDQVIDIIFAHADSDGHKTVARYIAGKLFTYLAQPNPKRPPQPALKTVVDELVSASSFDTTWEIAPLVRAIVVNDAFYATEAQAPFQSTDVKSVKWPFDYAITTLRLLNMKLKSRDQRVNFSSGTPLHTYLANMGQVLFDPPSVFGWDWETAWISSSTLLARYSFATALIEARGSGGTAFRPEKLAPIKALMSAGPATTGVIVDAVSGILGVTDQLASAERDALVTYLGGPAMTLDLNDPKVRNTKLNGVFALLLESPAYQLH